MGAPEQGEASHLSFLRPPLQANRSGKGKRKPLPPPPHRRGKRSLFPPPKKEPRIPFNRSKQSFVKTGRDKWPANPDGRECAPLSRERETRWRVKKEPFLSLPLPHLSQILGEERRGGERGASPFTHGCAPIKCGGEEGKEEGGAPPRTQVQS